MFKNLQAKLFSIIYYTNYWIIESLTQIQINYCLHILIYTISFLFVGKIIAFEITIKIEVQFWESIQNVFIVIFNTSRNIWKNLTNENLALLQGTILFILIITIIITIDKNFWWIVYNFQ